MHCQHFFPWYNEQHRHTGLALHTPADIHYGTAEITREKRAGVLDAAYAAHPERFVRKPPRPPEFTTETWINRPDNTEEATQIILLTGASNRLTDSARGFCHDTRISFHSPCRCLSSMVWPNSRPCTTASTINGPRTSWAIHPFTRAMHWPSSTLPSMSSRAGPGADVRDPLQGWPSSAWRVAFRPTHRAVAIDRVQVRHSGVTVTFDVAQKLAEPSSHLSARLSHVQPGRS